MHQHNFDRSKELLIQRWGNGVKLVRPSTNPVRASNMHNCMTNVLGWQHPLLIYLYDTNNKFQHVNEALAATNGFESVSNAIGKTMFSVAKKECAEQLIANNADVIKENKIKLIEEEVKRKDRINLCALTIKAPLYNDLNHIIGVFGCSIVLGEGSLAESLVHVVKLGLLEAHGFANKNLFPRSEIAGKYLSTRETQCLRLYVRGQSAKTIAAILGLSTRTVENYLANVKEKFHVSSKGELIALAMNHFHGS